MRPRASPSFPPRASSLTSLRPHRNRHPSGFFVSGDTSQLDGIIRKSRARRVESGRRDSLASTTSADSASSPYPQYDDGQAGPSYSTAPRHSFSYAPPPSSAYPQQQLAVPHDPSAAWTGYSSSAGSQPAPIASGSSFPAYLGAPSSYGTQYEPSQWAAQPGYRRASLTQFRVDTSPRTKPADAPGAQVYHSTVRSDSPQQQHALTSVPSGGDLRSSYASDGYPVELGGRPPAPAGYHYIHQPSSSSTLQHQHVVPSGLPVSAYDPHPHRPSWPPSSGSFYTPMPHSNDESSTLAPLHSYHTHAHHSHHPHEEEPVAHSSEEDAQPIHAHASAHPHSHAYPSTALPRHDVPPSAQSQPHLAAAPAVNLFPNLTHFHLPPPTTASSATAVQPHSHSYEQWRAHAQLLQQQQERRSSLQLPPFAPGPASSTGQYSHAPAQQQQQQYAPAHPQQQQYGDSGSSGRTTPVHGVGASAKLGWAPPPASTHVPGAAAAGVFGQWAGFGAHGSPRRDSPERGGAGGGREGGEGGGGG